MDIIYRESRLMKETRLGAPLTYFYILLLLLHPILYILYIFRRTIRAITRTAGSKEAPNDTSNTIKDLHEKPYQAKLTLDHGQPKRRHRVVSPSILAAQLIRQ